MRFASPSSVRAATSSTSRSWTFERLDNCQFASVTISQRKARVVVRYRRPTLVFELLIGKGAFFNYLTTLDDIVASRGGNPLIVGGKVVGAIGVSGGSGALDGVLSLAACGYYLSVEAPASKGVPPG
jgi:uncharacterized protein GlcG (DUF336 family)